MITMFLGCCIRGFLDYVLKHAAARASRPEQSRNSSRLQPRKHAMSAAASPVAAAPPGSPPASPPASVTSGSVGEVHSQDPKTIESLTAHLVQGPEESRTVTVSGREDVMEKKAVYPFVMVDQGCAIQP